MEIYKLSIGQSFEIDGYIITRVPGGWIYKSDIGLVFVPFKKEKESSAPKPTTLSIEDRAKNFKKAVVDAAKGRAYENDYNELKSFYEYWSEHGPHDKKMRFEKQDTFGIPQRLATWFRRKQSEIKEDVSHNTSLITKRLGKS